MDSPGSIVHHHRQQIQPDATMTKTIEQSVTFSATPQELYDIYIDPKKHSAFTGGPVKISAKPGSKFDAFNGMLWGSMISTVPCRQVIQRWRSAHFKESDPDSILILNFVPAGNGARIEMAHVNVPKQDHKGVSEGWPKYYWKPLRAYLKKSKN
jgi:activator of HSP90 ATPase